MPESQKQLRSTATEQRYRRDTADRVANSTLLTALRTRHCYLRSSVVVADVAGLLQVGRILY